MPLYSHTSVLFSPISRLLSPLPSATTHLFPFFFFQAEDGIRDHCVTGVQTCALPISRVRVPIRDESDLVVARRRVRKFAAEQGLAGTTIEALATAVTEIARNALVHAQGRSEERRVGKECRSRWSPDR